MNKELWVMVLTFIAGVLALASQMLPIPPDFIPWLAFLIAVINLALAIFFGVTGFQIRKAAKAAAK